MHLYYYENKNFNKIIDDGIRDFCLCERVNEEYMRSLNEQTHKVGAHGAGGMMKMERKCTDQKKILLYGIMILLLLVFQKVLGKVGGNVADSLPCEKFDPYKAFAWVSIHHITEMLIALAVIMILSKLLKVDFGLGLGDRKKGTKYVLVYTAIFAGVTLVCHILMLIYNMLPVYNFPLNKNNILGTLGFQLFLSGPAEEILYRALPITMLMHLMGKSVKVKWGITLETIIASFLFTIAHMNWTLFPFTIEANYFQLFYAFVLGIIQGKAYQDSRSILYPIFMHSISNVLMVGTGYLFIIFK
ncbi:MAG TPA: CPBP family intramembrane metalloprotease [Clostridiales bacterium]|nr:CPBP family intramembrane metalloprotease [Clostridiales bacterium]